MKPTGERVVRWALFSLVGCAACARPGTGSAIDVVVQISPDIPADCIEVAAWSTPGREESTRFQRTSESSYQVGIFPGGSLTQDVSVVARGYVGAECGAQSAQSSTATAAFAPVPPRVTLTLVSSSCPGCLDGGADAGSDAGAGGDSGSGLDSGSSDSGSSDGGSSDSGTDSGLDSGVGDDGGCQGQDGGQACAFGTGVCAEDGTCAPQFPYPPSNFSAPYPPIGGAVTLGCQARLDTTSPGTAPNFLNWCNQPVPGYAEVTQGGGGSPAVLLAMSRFTISSGGSLTIDGGRPVIFAVFGDALVQGGIFAGASGSLSGPGAGSPTQCGIGGDGGFSGANGSNRPAGGGGGGGGFGTGGASGGAGNNTSGTSGAGGGDAGEPTIRPLRGGCQGGSGGPGNSSSVGPPGGAGGAVQISAAGVLSVSGVIAVPGGGGGPGFGVTMGRPGSGPGGGGAGGAILLEGKGLTVTSGARLTANGGGGGGAGDDLNAGAPGSDGSGSSASAAPGGNPGGTGGNGGNGATTGTPATAGQVGQGDWGSGGGGGAGLGRIRVNATDGGCSLNAGSLIGLASSQGCP